MHIRIKKAELKKKVIVWKEYNDIVVTMVWLYDDNWKWIKWLKLNDVLLDVLLKWNISIDYDITLEFKKI